MHGPQTAETPDGAGFSPAELRRYARHIVLDEVGLAGQRKLKEARVLCVGAGGLGSPLALYLAAAGVGTLGIVDFDDVDASNLQRQILHGTSDIGRSKLDSAGERLQEVNPHTRVVNHPVRLESSNALHIIPGYDVVVDGTDNFPTRYLVNDACVLAGVPNVFGSVLRWEGQVAVFAAPHGPCYRCVFRDPPPPGLVPDCAEGGVLGALPGVIGSMQALEAVKLILGAGESVAGRLLLFNALTARWREIRLRRDPECPVCGNEPTQKGLIDYDVFCGTAGASDIETEATEEEVGSITAVQLANLVEGARPPLVLDVREPWEWAAGNLAALGALPIPMGELAARTDELRDATEERPGGIVVCCRSGVRSLAASAYLVDLGFRDVFNLEGGMKAWASEVDPEVQVV